MGPMAAKLLTYTMTITNYWEEKIEYHIIQPIEKDVWTFKKKNNGGILIAAGRQFEKLQTTGTL